MYNPIFNQPYATPYTPALSQQIIRVNGQQGANAYQMAANSSALLLDNTDALVWLAQTDGAGYKTVTPYTITPYEPKPAMDLTALLQRVEKLEEKINGKPDNIKAQQPE